MTHGGAANGRSDVKMCNIKANWMSERDGIFDRGPVKSNLFSQELTQDLPRGESRIGVTMSVSSTAEQGQQRRQCGTATIFSFPAYEIWYGYSSN
jgi:hypothetical protein